MNARRMILLAVVFGCFATTAQAADPPAKVALQGARIIPIVGAEIPSGTLLMENGKITAIGAEVAVPYDAMVVDLSGKVLFPGMILAHSEQGLDVPNENLPVTPYLDVYDALDPSSTFFENSLRNGMLAIHVIQGNSCVIGGLSRVVHPIGLTPDEMTIRPGLALKLSTSPKSGFDRMTQMAALRETFQELEYYLENVAEQRYEAKLAAEKKKIEVGPAEARKQGRALIRDEHLDDQHRNLVKLTDGRLDAWIYCGSATDVAPAIQVAKQRGFLEHTVFVLGTDAYRAVDALKEARRPVVLPADLVHQERDPITGELRETFVPKVIHEADLQYALLPNPGSSLAEGYLTYQAARCVREGIPRQAALEAITLNGAHMLGLSDQLGSLEAGKAGYVLVLSGDPLDFNTWVEKAYVQGVLAYDRTTDVRLNEMLGREKAAAEKAAAEKAAAEKAAAEKAAAEKAAAEKAAAEKAAAEKAAAEKAAAEKAAAEKAAAEKAAGEKKEQEPAKEESGGKPEGEQKPDPKEPEKTPPAPQENPDEQVEKGAEQTPPSPAKED